LDKLSAAILWLHQWQTLVGGLLAIVAAWLGVSMIKRQIGQADKHEQERNRRRLAAARVVFPLTLSSLCGYATNSAHYVLAILATRRGNSIPRDTSYSLQGPSLPDDAIQGLMAMAEAADEEVSAIIWRIADRIQVQYARLSEVHSAMGGQRPGSVITADNLEVYLIDAARIYALATSLFSFARPRKQGALKGVDWNDVASALSIMEGGFEISEGVYETLEKIKQSNASV
jgi:hypothetical protein